MDGKDDAKVAEAAAGVEKLSLSKKKKFKFVKVDPKELNIVIDDGRGRDTDFRNNNKPNHVKSQDSRKSSSHHADKGSGGSSRHAGASGGGATSRNMSRGSSKHTPASSNYKADFEVNEESSLQHNKKQKRDSSKINPSAISQQASNDKEFKNNLMWDGETAKKSRNQWKNLEVNNITNKARERITKHVSSNDSLPSEGEVDSRTTTAPILDSSLYQNTYDSKTRNFVDSGSQLFNTASSLTDAPTEHVNREDKLFSNEALYAPTSYTSSSAPTYAAMTTASANSTNAGSNSNASGVYSTNSFIAATTHGYSSISNTITNTQPAQQQNNNSVYSSNINTYSTFPQQNSSVNMNSYGQEDSSLSSNNTTGYSSQSLYQQQPSSVSYTSNSYVYPQTSISSSSNLSSTSHKYPPYGVDIKNHLDSKSTMESKSSVEHPSYMDYSNYMTSQYQDSLLKDIKTTADTLAHFEFRNPLEITPIIPVDNYIPNYIQPGPPPQSNSEYKMLYSQYWNNVPMTNILHPPPPQPPHSTMYKYTPHMPYDIQPTSQAAQKPFMKMNESTAGSDSSAYMRLHHRYPLDNTTTNKMPLAYTEPQPPNLQSSLSEYQRHHFTDFGNFQTPPLGSLMQHNYQTNDTFGSTDLPTRIHQPPTSVHPYFNNTEDSAAQRYGLADSGLHARNKRAITGGTNQPQHFNSRSPHYQHTPGYPRHTGYEDKDLSKPPVPHTSGNIFVNHNKYEPHFPPPTPTPTTVLPPAAPEKLRKPTTNPSPTVVTSIITSTANTHVTTAPPIGAKPAEALEKPPTETFKKEPEENAISGKKTSKPVHQSPAKTNNTTQQPNERGQQKLGGERSRDRGDNGRAQQHQNNMIKTIDFHQFQNNVMKNHPGNGKGFRSFNNKTYGDNKNKNEFKVTKIMQRPVDENKEEIAKLPISLGGEKLEETKNGKKVDDENKSKDSKNTKSANNGANKKTSKQQNIQILSPAKKTTKDESKVEKENKDSKQTDEKSKSSEDKENKSDDKTKESKISDSKDIARPNKREEGIRENKQQQQQQQRRKFNYNYNPKYVRHPYHNNMGDFQYVPMFDGSMNKFNKFNGGGHNRYPHPRYYDFDIDPRDPRMCLYTGGPGPYAQYGGSGGAPPMYNNLYNSNNYNNHKNKYKNELSKPSTVDKKQGSVNAEEKKAKTSQKQKSEDESKKTSNKKIKFKGTEILNESSSPSSSAVHSNALTAAPSTTPDNSSNPSSILKKSKTNEDCKDKLVQETTKSEKNQKKKVVDLDEREPSTIQVSKSS